VEFGKLVGPLFQRLGLSQKFLQKCGTLDSFEDEAVPIGVLHYVQDRRGGNAQSAGGD